MLWPSYVLSGCINRTKQTGSNLASTARRTRLDPKSRIVLTFATANPNKLHWRPVQHQPQVLCQERRKPWLSSTPELGPVSGESQLPRSFARPGNVSTSASAYANALSLARRFAGADDRHGARYPASTQRGNQPHRCCSDGKLGCRKNRNG